ncbi:MAG: PAS domain-containing sensor histidine kinase [Gammaproteobacteria bacterium]|nr:PAS domain-containing sensor histidine kinase [Gammaproteobacteria bacterium]
MATTIVATTLLLFLIYRNTHRKEEDRSISLTSLFVRTLDQLKSSAFIVSVSTGRITFCNAFCLRELGFERPDIIGHTVDILEVDGVLLTLRNQFKKLLADNDEFLYFDTLLREKNGGTRAFEVFLQKMQGDDDDQFFVAIMQDITEKKRIEKLQHQLISTVSHELRTPLTSIKGSLGLLDSRDLDKLPEKTKFLIEMARKNSDRLMYLINDILDLERFRHKDVTLNLKDTDLSLVIRESIAAILPYAKQFDITIAYVESMSSVIVRAEAERMLQVLNNLLSNAIKYSPRGSIVHVNTQLVGERIRVNITDEGKGIPESMRESIFQPFSRSIDNDSQIIGTGLGLPISVAIIKAHNGFLSFDSQEGVGTRFYFELPIVSVERRNENLLVTGEENASM